MDDSRNTESEISLEHAQLQSQQRIRPFNQSVLSQLDNEASLTIEINGVPVASVPCMDSALAELAAGWALMHQFCDSPGDFDRATAHDFRASVMVGGGIDILHHRGVLMGERVRHIHAPEPWPRDEEWTVPDDVLLDVLRETWGIFRKDRMIEGSIHAALANEAGIEVVAFDINPANAVAKVLGWCMIQRRLPAFEILVVNGLVTQTIVDSAARMGVKVIASPHVPTADAYKTARVAGMALVGYMRQHTVGLFGNPGIVTFEDAED